LRKAILRVGDILLFPFDRQIFIDEDIKTRYVSIYGDDRVFAEGQIPSLRAKSSSLSEFIRVIKVGFARYYNYVY
jgi:hypothetical protein